MIPGNAFWRLMKRLLSGKRYGRDRHLLFDKFEHLTSPFAGRFGGCRHEMLGQITALLAHG